MKLLGAEIVLGGKLTKFKSKKVEIFTRIFKKSKEIVQK